MQKGIEVIYNELVENLRGRVPKSQILQGFPEFVQNTQRRNPLIVISAGDLSVVTNDTCTVRVDAIFTIRLYFNVVGSNELTAKKQYLEALQIFAGQDDFANFGKNTIMGIVTKKNLFGELPMYVTSREGSQSAIVDETNGTYYFEANISVYFLSNNFDQINN